ncbi:hypothetical protein FRC01_003753 [Tulasnella sp. 417]|nr:hypothetical protein FRC01_003753 [Tulasnella sp. 417]
MALSTLSETTNLEPVLQCQLTPCVPTSNPLATRSRSNISVFPWLPEDVIYMIAPLLTSKKDLASFIKTCRTFKAIGTPLLYAHIQICHRRPESDPLLATLYRRPDLTKYIKSYCGPLNMYLRPIIPSWEMMWGIERLVQPKDAPERNSPANFKQATATRGPKLLDELPNSFGRGIDTLVQPKDAPEGNSPANFKQATAIREPKLLDELPNAPEGDFPANFKQATPIREPKLLDKFPVSFQRGIDRLVRRKDAPEGDLPETLKQATAIRKLKLLDKFPVSFRRGIDRLVRRKDTPEGDFGANFKQDTAIRKLKLLDKFPVSVRRGIDRLVRRKDAHEGDFPAIVKQATATREPKLLDELPISFGRGIDTPVQPKDAPEGDFGANLKRETATREPKLLDELPLSFGRGIDTLVQPKDAPEGGFGANFKQEGDIWELKLVDEFPKSFGEGIDRLLQPNHALEGDFPVIFKQATAIRELTIMDNFPISFGELTLAIIAKMPLTKLEVRWYQTPVMPLTRLLRVQPKVRQLVLQGYPSSWDLDNLLPEDLLNLENLVAQVGTIKKLAPGRPIHSVEVHSLLDQDVEEDLWIKLSQSSASILKLDIWEWKRHQLEQAARHLPSIRHLRLRGYYLDVDEASRFIAKTVECFPHLETLDITTLFQERDGRIKSPRVGTDDDLSLWDENTPKIFEKSKTLTEINIWKYKSFQFVRNSTNGVE